MLPSGGGRGNSYSLYPGITRTQWLNMYNYTSLVFAALLIIHLLLHWKFFRNIGGCLSTEEKKTLMSSKEHKRIVIIRIVGTKASSCRIKNRS